MRRIAILATFLWLLAGCSSTPEKASFNFGLDSTAETKRLMWPPEKDGGVPRYFYAGELTGENNFVRPAKPTEGAIGLLTRFLDIVIGKAPPLTLDRPLSGVVDESGRILVTDMGRGGVFVFDEMGGTLSLWEKAHGTIDFISPVGIALGANGEVFVADPELALVAHLDRNGHALAPIGRGQLKRPTGVAFEPKSGHIFVCDTQSHHIKVFDLAGQLLATWGGRGEGPGQFNYPTHIAVNHEKLYVSDTLNARVQVLSASTGEYLGSIGKRGLYVGDLVRPKGVATDSEQNIYVIESYHDYLLVYNRHGEFLLPIGGVGNGPGNFHLPAGVWVDVRNRVFVADMLNSRVAVFQFMGGDGESEER